MDEKKIVKETPDNLSQETVLFWARAGKIRRAMEEAEYERIHYDRLKMPPGNPVG